jgi:hypothetical protein
VKPCAATGVSREPGAAGEEDTSWLYRRMSIDIRQYGSCSNVCLKFIISEQHTVRQDGCTSFL